MRVADDKMKTDGWFRGTARAGVAGVNDRYKRPFDLVVTVAALLLLLPLWLALGVAIAVAIRSGDRGPVLYRQERLGRDGRVFRIVKFRTMVLGAEDGTGPVRAVPRDARVTAVGRLLRRFHLDELPQAVNVLRGEMSLVGPRPERPALAARFEREAPGFSWRLRVRPGVMGLAQALGSYHWPPRRKLAYDNLYIDTMHPWLDVEIAVRCVRRVLRAARRRTAPVAAPPPAPTLPGCDYLLAVGPGRSGSTFLYRLLNGQALRSPTIKDAYYYRSPRRFERALRCIRTADPAAVLLDVANLAWRDPWLLPGVEELRRRGRRVLLVVLLREHRARARSVMAFRRSRGARASAAALQRAAVHDSLAPEDLTRLFGMGANVLTVDFEALVRRTDTVCDVLADLCGIPRFETGVGAPVNVSVRARNRWLAAAGKLAAAVLRAAGCRRLLQRLKDSPRVMGVFFRPVGAAGDPPSLDGPAGEELSRRYAACRRTLDASSDVLAEGVWLRRAAPRHGFGSGTREGAAAASSRRPEEPRRAAAERASGHEAHRR